MQTAFDIAADLDTPVSAYLKLKPFKPRFLLESVEHGERLGRYSFIGFGDALDVVFDGESLSVGGQQSPAPETRDEVLDALRSALRAAPRPHATTADVPFNGGLVGAAGYGIAHRFEHMTPARTESVEPDAIFCAPSSVLAFDHVTRRVALLHDGTDTEHKALRKEIIAALRGPLPKQPRFASHAEPEQSIERPEFLSSVAKVKGFISAGDVFQLVLSVRFSGECHLAPFQVYRALRLLNPSPYMFFCDFGDTSIVGSSPEALVRHEGREVFLRPIAGTRPRGADCNEDNVYERELLADPKENAEHVMLVDLARNDLGRVAVPGTIAVDPFRTIERYSHVMHMVSGVRGKLAPGADAFDVFAASFPAGTVVGAPKIRAMEILNDLEPTNRGFYAGTVGYFGHGGSMDQAIAIRTLVFQNGSYAYQAGAGIVADSIPEREHDEVMAKGAALEAALALAEEGL